MASAFISYSHADEELRNKFETHLAMLKREGAIEVWHDRQMLPGDAVDETISRYLLDADVIIALISPEYLASSYCYEKELSAALERQAKREARLVCVILKHCDWKASPLSRGLACPRDGKPVVTWTSIDEAFLDVVESLRKLLGNEAKESDEPRSAPATARVGNTSEPRSSNLRVKSEFSQVQKDRFFDETFAYVRRFFENSLEELSKRNTEIEFRIRDNGDQEFFVNVYRKGADAAQCTLFVDSSFGSKHEICYSPEAAAGRRSYQASLHVEADDESLYLTGSTFGYSRPQDRKLTMEGAAEYFWSLLIERLR